MHHVLKRDYSICQKQNVLLCLETLLTELECTELLNQIFLANLLADVNLLADASKTLHQQSSHLQMIGMNSQSLTRDGVIMLPWGNAIKSHQHDIMKVAETLMDMRVLL